MIDKTPFAIHLSQHLIRQSFRQQKRQALDPHLTEVPVTEFINAAKLITVEELKLIDRLLRIAGLKEQANFLFLHWHLYDMMENWDEIKMRDSLVMATPQRKWLDTKTVLTNGIA